MEQQRQFLQHAEGVAANGTRMQAFARSVGTVAEFAP